MIGKPEWFDYKILGWGIRPKKKEAWFYLLAIVVIAIIISILPIKNIIKTIMLTILVATVVIDAIHIMFQLSKTQDEREQQHQLVIERAASIIGVVAILICYFYEYFFKNNSNDALLYVIFAMAFTKLVMFIYVKRKM